MKKLLLSLTAITLVTSSAVTVVSCNYIDTVEVSVKNKINEVMKSTSHFFKPAILANVNNFSREKVKSFLEPKKLSEVEPRSNDSTTVKQQLNMFFDKDYLSQFENDNFVGNEDFEGVENKNEFGNVIELISGLFGTIYGIIGEGFSPVLIQTIFEMVDLSDIVGQVKDLNETLKIFQEFNPISKIKLDLKIEGNGKIQYQTLKTYTILNLVFFIEDLLNVDHVEHNPDEIKKLLKQDGFKKYTKKVFGKILDSGFEFKIESIQYIVQFLYGMGWYIEAFENYNVPFEEVKDDNHLFDKKISNNEVFKQVNNDYIETSELSFGLNGSFELLFSIFNSKPEDAESYETSRILKLLFQVDEDTNMDLVEKPYESKMNLRLKRFIGVLPIGLEAGGTWGSYESSFDSGGLLVPIINSALDGILFKAIDEINPIISAFVDTSIPYSIGHLISSMLSNNNLNNFFIDFANNPGELFDIFKFISEKVPSLELPPIDDILNIIKLIGTSGVLNKPFTQIMNGDLLGQLIELITGNKSNIRNISELMNFKVFNDTKLGGLISTISTIVFSVPDLLFKMKNSFEIISNKSTFSNYRFTDAIGLPMPPETFLSRIGLDINQNPTDFAIGARILNWISADGFYAINKEHPDEKYRGSDFAKNLLGISENDTLIEDGILDTISKIWNNGSGTIVKGLMKTIKTTLNNLKKLIPSDIDENKYMDYLDSHNFKTNIINYTNFVEDKNESKLVYEIEYKNIDNNRIYRYEVSLMLPKRLSSYDEIKYAIEYFKII